MEQSPTILPAYIKSLAVLLLIIVIVFILIVGRSILVPFFLAGLLSMLLVPMANWMEQKISRTGSTIVCLLTGTLAVFGLLTFIVVQIAGFSKDLGDTSDKLNAYLKSIDEFLSTKLGIETGVGEGIDQEYLIDLLQTNSSNLAEFVFGTLGSLTSVVLMPVFIFFFLIYRDHFGRFVASVYANHDEQKVMGELKNLRKVAQKYIIGMLKVMAILAVLNTGVLFGLGIKHAVFFGVFAAILNIIPYLGPFLGAILPTIFAFLTKDSLLYPLGVVISFQVIQLIESNFLTPKIVGSNVNLNAFVTFLGLLVGAAIWGVVGMILIIPSLAILRKIFELSEATMPYALLLGEEKTEKESANEKA